MSASTKFYLRAPDLEFQLDGPIKIGNVITDMTLPQDPITFFDPLPKIISGSSFGKGKTESKDYAAVNAGLSAKIYDVFGGQGEAKVDRSLSTIYEFESISASYLEKNPTVADAKTFCEKDIEFKNALQNGPVYIVTGLKFANLLKYSNQRASHREVALSGGAHVTRELAAKGELKGEHQKENTAAWTILGDPILAYRLHIIKHKNWLWRKEKELIAKSYKPGDAGFMNLEKVMNEFEVSTNEVTREDFDSFATEQEFEGVQYLDLEDEGEKWSLGILDENL